MIYFIRGISTRRIKIGYSSDAEKRIRGLRGANADDVEVLVVVPGGRKAERRLHRKFSVCRHHDEWFNESPELLAYIRKLLLRHPAAESLFERFIEAHPQARVHLGTWRERAMRRLIACHLG